GRALAVEAEQVKVLRQATRKLRLIHLRTMKLVPRPSAVDGSVRRRNYQQAAGNQDPGALAQESIRARQVLDCLERDHRVHDSVGQRDRLSVPAADVETVFLTSVTAGLFANIHANDTGCTGLEQGVSSVAFTAGDVENVLSAHPAACETIAVNML